MQQSAKYKVACCSEHYRRAKELAISDQAVQDSCTWENVFKGTPEVPQWQPSEVGRKMESIVEESYEPAAAKPAWVQWQKFAALDGNQELMQPNDEELALRQTIGYLDHRTVSGPASVAQAVTELWIVDRRHQELGLYNPIMSSDRVKAVVKKYMEAELQGSNSADRRQELMEHELQGETNSQEKSLEHTQPMQLSAHITRLTAHLSEPTATSKHCTLKCRKAHCCSKPAQEVTETVFDVDAGVELLRASKQTFEQEHDEEYFRADSAGLKHLCAHSMSAEEVSSIGATGDEEAMMAYVASVLEMMASALGELPVSAGLTKAPFRKLLHLCMYKTFGVGSCEKFAPEKTGQEAFAMEQVEIAGGSNLLHDFVVSVISKKRVLHISEAVAAANTATIGRSEAGTALQNAIAEAVGEGAVLRPAPQTGTAAARQVLALSSERERRSWNTLQPCPCLVIEVADIKAVVDSRSTDQLVNGSDELCWSLIVGEQVARTAWCWSWE